MSLVEQVVKLKEENAKLKQELKDAYECLEIQRGAATKRSDCPLCKMNEAPSGSKN